MRVTRVLFASEADGLAIFDPQHAEAHAAFEVLKAIAQAPGGARLASGIEVRAKPVEAHCVEKALEVFTRQLARCEIDLGETHALVVRVLHDLTDERVELMLEDVF